VSRVLRVAQIAVDEQGVVLHVDDPNLRDAVPRIERHFDVAVVAQRRIADFDDQQRVSAELELATVEIRTRREQHEIGLGLGPLA